IYDPFTRTLEGWRLNKGRYRRIKPDANGRLWCDQLGLAVGAWQGEFQGHDDLWLRFHDADGNVVRIRGEWERGQVEGERQRAEAERQRADAAEAELARLRQELAVRRPNGPTPPPAE